MVREHDRVRTPTGLFGRVESIRNGMAVVIYETTPPWQPGKGGELKGVKTSTALKRTVVIKEALLQPA